MQVRIGQLVEEWKYDNYKKYGVIAPTAWPTGPGFITKDKAAAVIELSKKGYR